MQAKKLRQIPKLTVENKKCYLSVVSCAGEISASENVMCPDRRPAGMFSPPRPGFFTPVPVLSPLSPTTNTLLPAFHPNPSQRQPTQLCSEMTTSFTLGTHHQGKYEPLDVCLHTVRRAGRLHSALRRRADPSPAVWRRRPRSKGQRRRRHLS